jgi:hypothetical protein
MSDDLTTRALRCVNCGNAFTFPADEREGIWFHERAYPDPIRCPACRGLARQAAKGRARDRARNAGLICRDCAGRFQLSAADKAWYEAKALHVPTRCSACRRARREMKQAS